MYLTLTLFAATASMLTGVSTHEANNATTDETARSKPLGSLHAKLRDDHTQQIHSSNYLQPETSKVPAFINDDVGLISNRNLQIQSSTIYETDRSFVKNRSSTHSLSELKSNYNLYNNTTNNIPSPKQLSDDTRTDKRNHAAKKALRAIKYTSTSDGNDGRVNNASNKTERLQDNTGAISINKLQRKDGVNHKTGLLLAPSNAKTLTPSLNSGVIFTCSCDNKICNYSYCNLTSVPGDLNPNITELLLRGNNISVLTINGFFRFRFLQNLVLSYNRISVVDGGAFNGLSRLTSLDLQYNIIGRYTDISYHVFKPLKSLKTLRLYGNDFPCDNSPPIQDRFLAYLSSLEDLYIDNYGNQEYGPGFKNMTSLRNLTFGCACSIGRVSNTSFINLQQITSLDISACLMHGNAIDVGAFVHLRNLTSLDISQNNAFNMEYLPRILRDLQNSNLKVLRMDNIVEPASINFINISITQYLPRTLTTLSARENNIISIDRDAFLNLPKSLQFVDLSDNFMMVQAEYFPLEMLTELEVLLVNTKLKECLSDDSSTLYFRTGSYSDNQQLKRHKKRQTNTNKKAAGFQLRELKLPGKLKRIQINVKNMHETFLRNLDNRNSLEEIDMRCSEIPYFDFLNLVNLPKLKYLNLGRSSLRNFSIPLTYEIPPIEVLILESNRLNDFLKGLEFSFQGLNNVSFLYLSLNQIKSLKRDLFKWLDKLEYLRLDNNPLTSFDATISNMEQLKLLSISNTGLPYLPSQVRSHIDHLCQARPTQITVDMSGCPIQCDCFNLDFLKWMVSSPAFHKNFTGYKCRYSDASFKYILDGYEETIRNLDRECAKNYPAFLVILAATMVLVCTVTGTVVYRFRWKIKYLYYAAYLKVMDANREERHEFKYDVFVAYDSEDARFVKRDLAPELENRDLKLLIHSRDFVAGTYIASNIVMAVAESRKTLVVLTRNLLESTWCNYEIQMATMEAVHTGRPVLVFLLKENIPSRELDVELLRYIKSNTYLPYPGPEEEGDEEIMKRFYDKLAHDLKC